MTAIVTRPSYVYVASSWRCELQPVVVETLRAASIDCYDFRNPEAKTGFSWREVKTDSMRVDAQGDESTCQHCGRPVVFSTFGAMAWEPDYDPNDDPRIWRHRNGAYAACMIGIGTFATPRHAPREKGSDWESRDEYLRMIAHPRAVDGFTSDFEAMQRADTFVMVLPCGKSAHLELGWAVGARKRTAILLEDPVEPELMYRMVDYLATSVVDLLAWLGVQD